MFTFLFLHFPLVFVFSMNPEPRPHNTCGSIGIIVTYYPKGPILKRDKSKLFLCLCPSFDAVLSTYKSGPAMVLA